MLDLNGAKVVGAIRADGARVLWHEGMLYVALSPADVRAVECPTEPRKRSGHYRTDDNQLSIFPPSCSCKRSAELSRMTRDQIIEDGKVSVNG